MEEEAVVHRALERHDGANGSPIKDTPSGCFILAAWMPIHGERGNQVIHDKLQIPDGRMCEMEERNIPLAIFSKCVKG